MPWLSVLGNHDLGNDDPYAACADQMQAQPSVLSDQILSVDIARLTLLNAALASTQAPLATVNGQRYGCEQFNLDKTLGCSGLRAFLPWRWPLFRVRLDQEPQAAWQHETVLAARQFDFAVIITKFPRVHNAEAA